MKKRFNITGVCIKDKHYMVDTADKINKMIQMVEQGDYFTVNRPRQFGKTTALNNLRLALSGRYTVISTSFEGAGDDLFVSEQIFCSQILGIFSRSIQFTDKEASRNIAKYNQNISSFLQLSDAITEIVQNSPKQIILMIDEVDKSSNSRTFLQFLGLLRKKYLAANAGQDVTFQSVILAGLHDVRTLKLAMRDESDARFNSPWNISAKFNIDMSFSAKEIETMLTEYQDINGIIFDTANIAGMVFQFTSGYPYLVSDICKIIDEDLGAIWTEDSVYAAVKQLLNEKNTLFEDVIKNIENDSDIKSVTYEVLIMGRMISFNPFAYEKGIMHGIFKENNGRLVIHNMIFEELIYNYMMEQNHVRQMQIPVSQTEESRFITDGRLDLEKILFRFQDFMFEEYRERDERFYESQARLIFLAYMKPIINGKGFYFVEPQTRENRRLDVVIIYDKQKYIIELKIWDGEKHIEKGREQLKDYMDIQNIEEGYLLIFNFNQSKEKSSQWIEVDKKKILEVML